MGWRYDSPDGNAPTREESEEIREKEREEEDRVRLLKAQDKIWKLRVNFDYPPIPNRGADWSVTNTDYDLGDVIGHGGTIQDSIEDWLERVCDRVDHVDFNKEDIAYNWS